jgi:sarcosine oxidase, subunit gamma
MSDLPAPAFPVPDAPEIFEGVKVALGGPLTRLSLRTRTPQGLPIKVCGTAAFGGGTALCLGPDEWMLMLPDGSAAPAISGMHSLTDISHRALSIHVTGPRAATLIESGCPLDLALHIFPVGKATRTIYDDVEIILWRTAPDEFRLDVWRSFAPHLWSALTLVAKHAAR